MNNENNASFNIYLFSLFLYTLRRLYVNMVVTPVNITLVSLQETMVSGNTESLILVGNNEIAKSWLMMLLGNVIQIDFKCHVLKYAFFKEAHENQVINCVRL